jgi:omega-amidase
MTVRIALAQVEPVWENPEATLRKVQPLIEKSAENGASIICFPEQFPTGWDPASVANAQPDDGEIFHVLSDYSKSYNIAVLGSQRTVKEGRYYNTCIVTGAHGNQIASYSKIHLFSPLKEGEKYDQGGGIATFSIGDMIFGIGICYDLRFPPLFRIYAAAGTDCVLVPSAWPALRMNAWELFIRTRALENQVFIAGINTVGVTPVDHYTGNSIVADPYGEIITRAPETEGVTFADLNPLEIKQARNAINVEQDREPDLYHGMIRNTRIIQSPGK